MSKKIEKSYCKFCGNITNTIAKACLSASENKHVRYECEKCGAKKELSVIVELKQHGYNRR